MYNNAPQEGGQVDPMTAARQFAQRIGSPQNLVKQFFSFVPAQMQGSPDQIMSYLLQSGRITQGQYQALMGTRR